MARYSIKLLLAGLLAFAGMAPTQAQNAYPLFEPADGILVGDVDTYVTTAADASDIINLWAACSVTTFLRGDGDCSLIDLAANVTGTLPVGNGGTGVTSLGDLTRVDDSNVTLTLGGTPTGALINSTSLTLGWTGLLPASRGGLGISTVTDDTVPLANGSAWVSTGVPNCQDTSGNHLNYDTSTNSFSCGTSSSTTPVTPANPTASVGLAAVNGTSVNFMRSDAAPALDQGITPTWTGVHTFNSASGGQAVFNGTADGNSYVTFQNQGTPTGYLGTESSIISGGANTSLSIGGINKFSIATGASGSVRALTVDNTSITSALPFYAPAGSASAPSHSFENDTDTGLYATADNRLRMAAGGVQALVVGDTFLAPQVPTLTTDGSAAAPAYSFSNDTNTGIYRWAPDSIGFAAGGSQSVGIDANALYTKDGTASLPALSFLSDPNTGMYRVAADDLGFAVNGIRVLRLQASTGMWNENGQFFNPDGAVGTPSFSFAADSNTGIYRIGADELGIAAGGTQVADFYSGGLILSTGTLFVPDGAAGTPAIRFSNDQDTGIYREGADSLGIATGGSNRVTVGPGVQVGSPTGGDQGAGTINATGLYINGVSVAGGGLSSAVVKTAATDRSSTTTLTSDPDLQFTAASGGTYDIQFCLAFGGVTTGTQGFKFAFNLTSAGTQNGMWGGSSRVNAAGAAHSGIYLGDGTGGTTGQVAFATISTGNGTNQVCGQGMVSQSGAVTYAIQWAQNSSNANATRLNQGSYIRFTRLN